MNASIPPIKKKRNECCPSKGALLLPLILLAGICFSSVAGAENEKCLGYDPEVVTLTGTLKREIHPGPPDYTSVEQGDEPLPYWFLYLDNPICVAPKKYVGYTEEGEDDVKKVQLVIVKNSLYGKNRHLLDRKIIAKGKLSHAIFGRHYTAILISLETVEAIIPAGK